MSDLPGFIIRNIDVDIMTTGIIMADVIGFFALLGYLWRKGTQQE